MAANGIENHSLAVLIDADNANPAHLGDLLTEIAKFGVSHVKRIYGDWTTPNLGKWKEHLLTHSIQPIQQFGFTKGKNSTDSAMIIDAMDLLYTNRFTGFCIVSSDSDFTRLATRIRESGVRVYGFGEQKTPKPFVAACDRFIYVENLGIGAAPTEASEIKDRIKRLRGDTALVNLLREAIADAAEENGWAHLGPVGNFISKAQSDFDPRTYGFKKLSELFEGIGLFEIERRGQLVFVRDKRK